MTIERLHSNEKLSRIVKHNHTVYLCGQVAKDYASFPDDVTAQTQAVTKRIDQHLKEAGTDKSCMLYATVYVKNRADIPLVNAVWNAWLKDCTPPARTCVVASLGNENILVEITVVAAY